MIFENESKFKCIGDGALTFCESLKAIVIPKSVTTLAKGVFGYYHNLEAVIFEKGSQLETIPRCCFRRCYKLKAIMIPDSGTIIAPWAFTCCHNLVSVYFSPESKLQYIDERAFITALTSNSSIFLQLSFPSIIQPLINVMRYQLQVIFLHSYFLLPDNATN